MGVKDRNIIQIAVSDIMVPQVCVDCHNNHPISPKKLAASVFDTMNQGIVVTDLGFNS